MATSFDDVKAWVQSASLEDLSSLSELTKLRRSVLSLNVGYSFRPGDRVSFDAKERGIIQGVFIKQNHKNAKVKADNGVEWQVAPLLLKAIK